MNDPVKSCPVYKNEGCSHVDGMLCDFPKCSIIKGYQYYCSECGYKREGLLDKQAIGIGSYSCVCPECGGSYDSYEVSI